MTPFTVNERLTLEFISGLLIGVSISMVVRSVAYRLQNRCKHVFTLWEYRNHGQISKSIMRDGKKVDEGSIGSFIVQERRCSTCGMVQLRYEKAEL